MFIVNKERVKNLKKILAKYPDILSNDDIEDSRVKSFLFEKILTSIELYDKKIEIIVKFIEELEDFFFVGHIYFDPKPPESTFSGLILISRFKNLFDVAINYANKHNGLLDEFTDLSGILFGYSPKEVAEYCSEKRLKKYNLIK